MVSYSTAKAEALGVRRPARRDEAAGARRIPRRRRRARAHRRGRVRARGRCPLWIARVPLFAVLALVAIVGNASAVRRLRAIAEAVRKPEPLRAQPPNGANALARDPHAAAGDALR